MNKKQQMEALARAAGLSVGAVRRMRASGDLPCPFQTPEGTRAFGWHVGRAYKSRLNTYPWAHPAWEPDGACHRYGESRRWYAPYLTR